MVSLPNPSIDLKLAPHFTPSKAIPVSVGTIKSDIDYGILLFISSNRHTRPGSKILPPAPEAPEHSIDDVGQFELVDELIELGQAS